MKSISRFLLFTSCFRSFFFSLSLPLSLSLSLLLLHELSAHLSSADHTHGFLCPAQYYYTVVRRPPFQHVRRGGGLAPVARRGRAESRGYRRGNLRGRGASFPPPPWGQQKRPGKRGRQRCGLGSTVAAATAGRRVSPVPLPGPDGLPRRYDRERACPVLLLQTKNWEDVRLLRDRRREAAVALGGMLANDLCHVGHCRHPCHRHRGHCDTQAERRLGGTRVRCHQRNPRRFFHGLVHHWIQKPGHLQAREGAARGVHVARADKVLPTARGRLLQRIPSAGQEH